MRILILLCLVMSFNVFAETSVWRVSKNNSELFIGGTIHILSASDYPLPVEFEQAYLKSDRLIFETDLTAMMRPDVQQQLLQRVIYKRGETLRNNIQPQTYLTLQEYAVSVGLDMKALNQFKPPMVLLTLMMAEFKKLGMAEQGVDEYFNQKAHADTKLLGELESWRVQLDVIARLGEGYEDEIILSTIAEMKDLSASMAEMKQAWRTGNTQALEQIGIVPMKQDYPMLHKMILINRNEAWLPKIEVLLTTPEVEFVLVGALHLIAHDGILARLRAMGYKVEQLK